MKVLNERKTATRAMLYCGVIFALFIGLVGVQPKAAVAAPGDTAVEVYYVPLPDDWLMQHMEDIDADTGSDTTGGPYPPVRSVIGISISSDGTVVWYDQWEDGSYDADIANPTNVYHAVSNPSGTQIWGDNNPSNGYPPRFKDQDNTAQRDVLNAGDVIVLDNLVPITAINNGNHGPWYQTNPYYSGRNAAVIRYDGKDKFGSNFPVAATRAGWSEGDPPGTNDGGPAGAMFSDGTAIEPTKRWGTHFIAPVGTNTTGFGTGTNMNYAHLTIQAQQNGTTVCVDVPPYTELCNGTNDSTATINQGQQYDPTAMPNVASPQGVPHGTEVRTNYPVQVVEITGDVNSTWATRWYNLKPRDQWTNEYYQPVGTAGADSAVWVYNPNDSQISITVTRPSGSATTTCAAKTSCKMPNITPGYGGRGIATFTATGLPADYYAVSVTEASGAQLYDWGYSLLPSEQLSDQVLVGWAPGCTTVTGAGECFDQIGQTESAFTATGVFQSRSRSPVWVTPLANTTIYVDLDGQGVSCSSTPPGSGAERTIAATALTSYTIVDDPAGSVCDAFTSQSYGLNRCSADWAANWVELDDTDSPSTGAIQINTDDGLRFMASTGSEDDRSISRRANLSGNTIAKLKFKIGSSGTLDPTDQLAVEISINGSNFTTLETIFDDPTTSDRIYDISSYISTNTTVRFRIASDLQTGEYWSIDNVTISYGNQPWDFDMSGARLMTCDGTRLAAAWGQQPSLSYSGDDEGLDVGTVLFPLGSNITIAKNVDKSYVTPGGQVVYSYDVTTTGTLALSQVTVTDNYCAPATGTMDGGYNVGDSDHDGFLESGETWKFTCTADIFIDTINTAYAAATPDNGGSYVLSEPDQAYVRVTGAIGDYVWVDEDGDGDQDAGEPGIPNVKLTLTGKNFLGEDVSITVYTDASGRYIFPDLPPSDAAGYTITVDPASMPTGLAANPTYDENGIGTPHTTTVVLNSGVEHMSADFGYNWSSPTETNNPPADATGAIGDRIWVDTDGDGVQDPEEIGLPGITVELISAGPDGIFGTDDDVVIATTTTDNNGNYIFDDLPPGAYVVNIPNPPDGFEQTGDPDGINDNQTTDPIVLAPGDVYLNADFGYQPTGTTGSIGDRVWFDTDGDGVQDAGEYGIPGVSVSLIIDQNGNGVWDPGEPIIATDITDENGLYLFDGLPVGADYLVWVNDTANVLNELEPTNAPGGIIPVQDLPAEGIDTADFGFAPPGHAAGEGLIGDTIFLDRDGDGQFDPGEGLEGVVVNLRNAAGQIIARTVTDENGNYSFGNLPAGTYTVEVVTNTLPNGGTGLTNTVDPDGGTANRSEVTIGGTQPLINLDQDFGYRPAAPNSVGGTIWEDVDADGALEAGEPSRFEGITVALYADTNGDGILGPGDKLIGTTTTDSNGDYIFTGLPDGSYFVDVTDDANLLDGYWHSVGDQAETADNQSKIDPYAINLSGGENRTTVDFGYYRDPAGLGNWVWFDTNTDGIQDAGEPGIQGAVVKLTITYPNGVVTTLTTETDASGFYSFDNLLLDEDYDGVGLGEPTYSISVTPPNPYLTPSNPGAGTDRAKDSGLAAGETVWTVKGGYNPTYDFGFYYPTAVQFSADVRYDPLVDAFVITWNTVFENEVNSYNLVRRNELTGETLSLISVPATHENEVYTYVDRSFKLGVSYVYTLEVIGLDNMISDTREMPAIVVFKQFVPVIISLAL